MKLLSLSFVVGIPLLFLVVVWRRYARAQLLRREGVRVRGTVLRIEPGGSDSSAELHYCFKLPDGRRVTHTYTQDGESFDHLAPGASVDIDYLPSNPKYSQPVGQGTRIWGVILVAVMLVVAWVMAAGAALKTHEPRAKEDARDTAQRNKLGTY
ncbi:DUF3592 domain-containing protein [Corallococcus macrosporus]|uniref:DUF3592 domain-containing protein n=1 Tax=Corallococcus macrosporus TaxID=35 RepID=A0ABS3DN12_9BACT|nr:DUF3592 domain-containing protein [Corallococcus macrosporus]MBN8232708.1 DUF3592 domain-containing protein [Corallococcus macrosporus]